MSLSPDEPTNRCPPTSGEGGGSRDPLSGGGVSPGSDCDHRDERWDAMRELLTAKAKAADPLGDPTFDGFPHLGQFRLTKHLGCGAMGDVYSAKRDDVLARPVAVKILRKGTVFPEAGQRFRREVELLQGLPPHRNVVRLEFAVLDGTPKYLVMDLVEGRSVAEHAKAWGGRPFPWEWVADMIRQVAEGLAHLAEQQPGVVHGDLSPANILVEERYAVGSYPSTCRFVVTDFGLAAFARRFAPGDAGLMLVGTAPYWPPEYVRDGSHVLLQSDMYSLGVIAFQLLTGSHPFHVSDWANVDAVVTAVRAGPRVRIPDAPDELGDLVRNMVSLFPSHRPTAAVVKAQIDALFAHAGSGRPLARKVSGWPRVPAVPPQPASHAPDELTRNQEPTPVKRRGIGRGGWRVGGGAVLLLLAGVVAGLLCWPRRDPPETLILKLPGGEMIEFVRIDPPAGGRFLMGSSRENQKQIAARRWTRLPNFRDEGLRQVPLDRPYYLARTETTRGQFRAYLGASGRITEAQRTDGGGRGLNPETGKDVNGRGITCLTDPLFPQTDAHPVVNVSWTDANGMGGWLGTNDEVQKQLTAQLGSRRWEIGLPREAEWEHACRAGKDGLFPSGDDEKELVGYANVSDDTARARFSHWPSVGGKDGHVFTAPAASFPRNAFGLHDLTGNVWEWCEDVYEPSADEVAEAGQRVLRGGSFFFEPPTAYRCAVRYTHLPNYFSFDTGFRLCVRLPE